MQPSQFIPQSAGDFIGPAHDTALLFERVVRNARAKGNPPLKFLLNGNPGIGKSELVRYLQKLLGCDKWSTTKHNGTQLKLELLEELAANVHYKSLFNDYRMLWWDEVDQMSRAAQCRALTLLDELPNGVAVCATSNCKLKEFESRFQSRFQVLELEAPTPEAIAGLLLRFIPGNPDAIKHITTFACGNVRQALLDAEGVLQAAA